MYIVMSRSGSIDSSAMSWAITSFAEASSICTPRKMIRSSNSLLYGFISLIPYEVRSMNDGSTYLALAGAIRWDALTWFPPLRSGCSGDWPGCGDLDGAADHLVDEAVLLGL